MRFDEINDKPRTNSQLKTRLKILVSKCNKESKKQKERSKYRQKSL